MKHLNLLCLFQRQISDFNAMLSHVLDMIGTMRDEWDADQVSGLR